MPRSLNLNIDLRTQLCLKCFLPFIKVCASFHLSLNEKLQLNFPLMVIFFKPSQICSFSQFLSFRYIFISKSLCVCVFIYCWDEHVHMYMCICLYIHVENGLQYSLMLRNYIEFFHCSETHKLGQSNYWSVSLNVHLSPAAQSRDINHRLPHLASNGIPRDLFWMLVIIQHRISKLQILIIEQNLIFLNKNSRK